MAPPVLSLQRTLLKYILLPLGLLLIGSSIVTFRQAQTTADLVTDHNLLASARVLAQGIHVQDGVVEAVVIPAAIEMLASPQHDMVYYQLRGPDGALLAGQADLISTPANGADATYSNQMFRSQYLRNVTLRQQVVGNTAEGEAVVTVAETLGSRSALIQKLWLTSLAQQAILVTTAAALGLLGLHRGLSPLKQLQSTVGERKTGALEPLDAPHAPAEVQPMILALNDYIARLALLMETQRRFVANAAHQLRTPLTLLKAQASFGLRERKSAGKDEALRGVSKTLDHMTRLTNQLLALARAEPGTNHGARVDTDLIPILDVLKAEFSGPAKDRGIRLQVSQSSTPIITHGNPTLLRELMANLIDNALRYAPADTTVKAQIRREGEKVVFEVRDEGPGIAPTERDKVFERFYRVPGTQSDGSGLGLAIVAEIVRSHEGSIELLAPLQGAGLLVRVILNNHSP